METCSNLVPLSLSAGVIHEGPRANPLGASCFYLDLRESMHSLSLSHYFFVSSDEADAVDKGLEDKRGEPSAERNKRIEVNGTQIGDVRVFYMVLVLD